MDREFDSQHILEEISRRGLSYVVPKRMHTSEKVQAKRLLQHSVDRYETERKLHLGNDKWHETTLIYRRNEDSEHTDYRQYSVFMSNRGGSFLSEYAYRWEIESGYKSVKRFMAATTSKNFVLRFFYFAFACLLYSIWRTVDLLVQVQMTGEYEGSPVVTADNTLTLLKQHWSRLGPIREVASSRGHQRQHYPDIRSSRREVESSTRICESKRLSTNSLRAHHANHAS